MTWNPKPEMNDMGEILRNLSRKITPRWIAAGLVAIILLVGVFTTFYTVAPEGEAVVKRFGKLVRTAGPGLHMKWPYGIETQTFVPTRRVLKEEFGFRTVAAGQRSEYAKGRSEQAESLMLTGDLNVIDVEWVVQYRIDNPDKWLHQVRNPRETIRDVSEAVMRRVVGNRLGSEALTEGRPEIAEEVKVEMQLILEDGKEGGDDYEMGIHIGSVEMQDVTPPDPVKPAFNEVNKARQEKERLINEAEKLRNRIIPRARGEAEQTISEAQAYSAQRVNAAKGEAARFLAILEEYRKAPDVTRQRLYIEMADSVLPSLGQIYILEQGANQPLPLLDMNRAGAAGRGGR